MVCTSTDHWLCWWAGNLLLRVQSGGLALGTLPGRAAGRSGLEGQGVVRPDLKLPSCLGLAG